MTVETSGTTSHVGERPATLSQHDIAQLETICVVTKVEPGTVIAKLGSSVKQVLIVKSGEIELFSRTDERARALTRVLGPGDILGDIPLLLDLPMAFDAVANRPSVLLTLDEERWFEVLRRQPDFAIRWMRWLASRIAESRRYALILTQKNLKAQVATLLIENAEPGEEGLLVVERSQEDMADLLGARRPSVSRVMRELREEGMIDTRYGRTAIRDLEGVRAVAGPTNFPI